MSRYCIGLLIGLLGAGCNANMEPRPVHLDFEAVFEPLDAVRLDRNVPLSHYWDMDISAAGEILIMDGTDVWGTRLIVFAASGSHVRTLDLGHCDP